MSTIGSVVVFIAGDMKYFTQEKFQEIIYQKDSEQALRRRLLLFVTQADE